MLYLGIDMHSKWFTLAGFDKETGKMYRHKKTANTPEAMRTLFAALPSPRMGALETAPMPSPCIACLRRTSPRC